MNGGKLSTFVWYFNPRSREGSDYIQGRYICAGCISLHAPATAATAPPFIRRIHCCYFNPRSREGSDAFFTNFACSAIRFQSTLPRRERHCQERIAASNHNFNPRSREGSDGEKLPQRAWLEYFNPRSREGSDGYEADIRI